MNSTSSVKPVEDDLKSTTIVKADSASSAEFQVQVQVQIQIQFLTHFIIL